MLTPINVWLREQRLARGWSAAEMGRRLHKAAKTTGDHTVPSTAILTSYVRRWEAGKIGVTERYRLHYCTALGIPPMRFGPPSPPNQPPETQRPACGVLSSDKVSNAAEAMPHPRIVDDADSHLVAVGGYPEPWTGASGTGWAEGLPAEGAPDLLMTMIAEESLDFGEWADTSNIGDATLEYYAAQVRRLADDYQHAAPYPILLETKRLRDRVFAKLRGHQRPGQARELYLIAAQMCGLLAWMSGDMGFYRAADAHAWTGWVCADHADHDWARTWIRATQSKLAYWNGRFIESAQLASDGLQRDCPDSGRVMVALFHARALARLGRDGDAAEALARARDWLERAGDDEVGGLWSVIPARFHSLAGNVQLWRHDPRQVLAETSLALQQFEMATARERNYGAEIHTRIDQSHAHLLLGDLDGAEASLRPVLSLAAESRYEPITQHLTQVRQALTQPDFRDGALAQQLQEEIETYCQESIVNGLAS